MSNENEEVQNSETPIFDSVEQTAPVSSDVDHHDDEDVPAALERETSDGPGFESEDELPESNFEGYADSDVEVDES